MCRLKFKHLIVLDPRHIYERYSFFRSRWFATGKLVAGGFVYAGDDPHYHRSGHHFSAPKPSSPWFGFASGFDALFPLLALVDHWHGNQGMGGDSSQAPRPMRA